MLFVLKNLWIYVPRHVSGLFHNVLYLASKYQQKENEWQNLLHNSLYSTDRLNIYDKKISEFYESVYVMVTSVLMKFTMAGQVLFSSDEADGHGHQVPLNEWPVVRAWNAVLGSSTHFWVDIVSGVQSAAYPCGWRGVEL